MMSNNVKETCERHNLVTPCVGSDSCKYTDAGCNVTSLSGCLYPMKLFSQSICNGVEPRLCSRLSGIFAYMGKGYYSGSSYGTMNGNVPHGYLSYNQWALCASPKGNQPLIQFLLMGLNSRLHFFDRFLYEYLLSSRKWDEFCQHQTE